MLNNSKFVKRRRIIKSVSEHAHNKRVSAEYSPDFPQKRTKMRTRIVRTLWIRPINLIVGFVFSIFRSRHANEVFI